MKYQVREKLFALGEDNDILNENGQPVLKVDGKVLSIHGLMLVNDLTGAEVGRVSRKLVALRATYEITLTSGVTAELHQRFTGPFHPKWNFSVSGGEEMEMSRQLLWARLHAHGQRADHRHRVESLDQPRRTRTGSISPRVRTIS